MLDIGPNRFVYHVINSPYSQQVERGIQEAQSYMQDPDKAHYQLDALSQIANDMTGEYLDRLVASLEINPRASAERSQCGENLAEYEPIERAFRLSFTNPYWANLYFAELVNCRKTTSQIGDGMAIVAQDDLRFLVMANGYDRNDPSNPERSAIFAYHWIQPDMGIILAYRTFDPLQFNIDTSVGAIRAQFDQDVNLFQKRGPLDFPTKTHLL